jgi:transposase
MASTMERIAKYSFPRAKLVTDRFHVQKLAYEAVQEVRIRHRWEAIEQENNEIELARKFSKKHIPVVLENGDTLKQLLARSRYLLFKPESKWTQTQLQRANLLFSIFPDIKETYDLSMDLGRIYHTTKVKGVAYTKLAQWYDKVETLGYKSFNVIAKSISEHYINILNFFDNRSTNASAESFNAKIKAFRTSFRGVTDVSFFLFRLSNIYA